MWREGSQASNAAKPGDRRSPQPSQIVLLRTGQPSTPAREGAEEKHENHFCFARSSLLCFSFCTSAIRRMRSPLRPTLNSRGTLLDASRRRRRRRSGHSAACAAISQAHLWKATSTTAGEYSLHRSPGQLSRSVSARSICRRANLISICAAGQPRVLDLRSISSACPPA